MFSWRLLLAQGLPAVRRPDRAHAVQRRRHVAVARGHGVLLHEHAAPAGARAPSRRPTSRARGRRRRCARRGSPCRAARRTWPARWPASPRTSRPPTTTASSSTSTRRPRSARRWPTAAASSSTSRRPTRDDGVVRVTVATTRGPAVDADPAGARVGRRAPTLRHPRRRRSRRPPGTVAVHRRVRRRRRGRAAPADGARGCRARTPGSTRSAAASSSSAVPRCCALESVDLPATDVSDVGWTCG